MGKPRNASKPTPRVSFIKQTNEKFFFVTQNFSFHFSNNEGQMMRLNTSEKCFFWCLSFFHSFYYLTFHLFDETKVFGLHTEKNAVIFVFLLVLSAKWHWTIPHTKDFHLKAKKMADNLKVPFLIFNNPFKPNELSISNFLRKIFPPIFYTFF